MAGYLERKLSKWTGWTQVIEHNASNCDCVVIMSGAGNVKIVVWNWWND